jgi:hypothetical protein
MGRGRANKIISWNMEAENIKKVFGRIRYQNVWRIENND